VSATGDSPRRIHAGIGVYRALAPEHLVEVALRVEELGFDGFWLGEHPTVTRFGAFPDPLLALAHLAATTRSLVLGTSVLVLPYRNPVVVANEAATLDVLSSGRFRLGVGAGHDAAEFAALGIARRERFDRLDEGVEVLARLWAGGPVDFEGRYTQLAATTLSTAPRRLGGPPVWVGGNSDRALRLAAARGAAWHGIGLDASAFRAARSRLEALVVAAGRNPESVEATMLYEPEQGRDEPAEVAALLRAGLRGCVFGVGSVDARGLRDDVERVADELLPVVRAAG
jgi:probable F420-dependent oxidoreductase